MGLGFLRPLTISLMSSFRSDTVPARTVEKQVGKGVRQCEQKRKRKKIENVGLGKTRQTYRKAVGERFSVLVKPGVARFALVLSRAGLVPPFTAVPARSDVLGSVDRHNRFPSSRAVYAKSFSSHTKLPILAIETVVFWGFLPVVLVLTFLFR